MEQAMINRTPWLPIETAPKDGTEIDVWAGERVTNAHFRNGEWREWSQGEFGYSDWRRIREQVTHWMPIPQAPITSLVQLERE